ncbi:DUF1800 domain-containing protein [Rhodobacteraceae bacterium M382]|nr:DUF1800 domain-containing protein [Rhodobacteraceae bacterium M382]
MGFSSELAEIRFGCGLSPDLAAPRSALDILDRLAAPDVMVTQFPLETFDVFRNRQLLLERNTRTARKARKNQNTAKAARFQHQAGTLRKKARQAKIGWLGQSILRWTWTEQGFRERLVTFWADHFTAIGKAGLFRYGTPIYIEDAIRPHILGRFSDLLIAATTHPIMLNYLDQDKSVGPSSLAAQTNRRLKGVNENLAREVLELHTLGVEGPYDQSDVRQLAELFTGLTQNAKTGFIFRKDMAEPGAETVLGKAYAATPALGTIHDVLTDLAMHPATARHIASKLAVHFVSDTPDPVLIDHLTRRYQDTQGDLMQTYAALLEHPSSWADPLMNVKPPFPFVASACRALAVSPDRLQGGRPTRITRGIMASLAVMGQAWLKPAGPNGWPEEDGAWITPQGLAARMRWAMAAPQELHMDLPDPRQFHQNVLGRYATAQVKFAARSAETRSDAIGLTLMSPGFQRR